MNLDDVLKRYYAGETSIEEERMLKDLYRKGELLSDPVFAYGKEVELPKGLAGRINAGIHQRSKRRLYRKYLAASSVVACIILTVVAGRLLPGSSASSIYLSDRTKMERFEEAMRVIGNVLEEKTATGEKVLYEDQNFVIVME